MCAMHPTCTCRMLITSYYGPSVHMIHNYVVYVYVYVMNFTVFFDMLCEATASKLEIRSPRYLRDCACSGLMCELVVASN